MNNEVWTDGNEMKHDNEVDNVTQFIALIVPWV